MKKTLFALIVFLVLMVKLNAFCDYSKQKEYNVLSSYVSYKIDYVESSNDFMVTVYNLADSLFVRYNSVDYVNSNSESRIMQIKEGSQLVINILTNDSECVNKNLRTLYISIPYLNTFYKSEKCNGHEDLNVCISKFLDYKITESTFNSLLNKSSINNTKKTVIEESVEEDSFLNDIVSFLSTIFIPVILVILSSLITFLIFLPIYRKVKYGM